MDSKFSVLLNDVEKVLSRQVGGLTIRELVDATDSTPYAVRKVLNSLLKDGSVVSSGTVNPVDKGRPAKIFKKAQA